MGHTMNKNYCLPSAQFNPNFTERNLPELKSSQQSIMVRNVKLTEIPIELQSHILSKLSNQPLFLSKAPTACNIETVASCLESFPDDLLHAAQTSSVLSEAVISTLGSHAKFLSFRRSIRLSEWIGVLAKHVKAVSLTGTCILGYCERGCTGVMCHCNDFHINLLNVLEALHTNNLALVALNLEEFVNPNPERIREVVEHMVKAFQRSKFSLKEITVSANRATALTVSRVTLPNLEVAQIASEDIGIDGNIITTDVSYRAKLFGDILLGINAGASNLQELRLYNIHDPPIFDRKNCRTFFPAVKTLIILCGKTSRHREIAQFIANFRNIKTLSWYTGLMCPEDLHTILTACQDLEDLDLSASDQHVLPGDIDVVQNSSRLRDLFVSFQGKVSQLELHSCMSSAQITSLGENCPNLRTLQMEIDSENVQALCSLLGSHCRKLRALRLYYSKTATDCLGPDGWQAYTKGICSASDELREISLRSDVKGVMLEGATEEMALAIRDVLYFLGDRATSIVFQVPINTENPFVVLKVLSRTLRIAKIHCRSMELLCLDFIKDTFLGSYHVDNDQEDDLLESMFSVRRLQAEFNLCGENNVDIGDIEALGVALGDEDGEVHVEEMLNVPAELADILNDEMEE